MTQPMQLVPPSLDRLPSYVAALKRGWSPDNIKGAAGSIEELAHIEKDPRSFVESLTDREAKGPPIVLPDGSSAARLPGFRLWLLGYRVLRLYWFAVAAGHVRVAPSRPRIHWLCGCAMEGKPRLCQVGVEIDVGTCSRSRAGIRRNHDGPKQHCFPQSH